MDAGGQQQQQQVAGGRECQEQEKQQEGAGGAWDGAAANGGEAERGEGGHARDCKGKERRGATAAAPLRRTALTAGAGGRCSFAGILHDVVISTRTHGSADDLVLDLCSAAMRAGAALAVAVAAVFIDAVGLRRSIPVHRNP